MALYDRSVSIIVDADGARTIVKNVRIVFSCTKTADKTKNTANIKIYNLSQTTRDKIDKQNASITIMAGYLDDAGEEVLFIGDVVRTVNTVSVPDIFTDITLKDGNNAIREARLSESFKEGTSLEAVVKKLTSQFELPIKEISGIPDEQFANGFSVSGPVYDSLQKVADKAGLEWSVQNGEIQVSKKHEANSDSSIVLSPSTGLLGSPENLQKDGAKLQGDQSTNKKIKVRSLLIPKITPARTIKVESKFISGNFRVDSVTHSGDSHGDDWTSTAELREI